MTIRNGVRKELRTTMELAGTRQEVFPLLCPVLEFDWLDSWHCEVLFTNSGVAEKGCIFRTWYPDQGGVETWVVSHYEPDDHIEFVRLNASRSIQYSIVLEDTERGCRAEWTQVQTGLDPLGDAVVEGQTEAAYEELMGWIERSLNHWLTTGSKLKRR